MPPAYESFDGEWYCKRCDARLYRSRYNNYPTITHCENVECIKWDEKRVKEFEA